MLFGKKKPNFIAAVCPRCNANLEMDAELETAFCTNCNAHCIIENAERKSKKRPKKALDSVLDFVERQQAIRRKEKEAQRARNEEQRKYSLIYGGALLIVLLIIAVIGMIFGN